eukprot:14847487-Heterocapsa_arctica.AAC.1
MDSQHGQVSSDDDSGPDTKVKSFEVASATTMLRDPRKKTCGIKSPDCVPSVTRVPAYISG